MAAKHSSDGTGIVPVLERNIRLLTRRRIEDERSRPIPEQFMDRVAGWVGSLSAVWVHALLYGGWALANLRPMHWLHVDPNLTKLGVFASVEGIFLWTMVLLRQGRMMEEERRRNDLDLQISLLAEHEVTRMMSMLRGICEKVGVECEDADEIEELEARVGPDKILDRMEQASAAAENHDVADEVSDADVRHG